MSFSLKGLTANRSILMQVGALIILCQILAQVGTLLFMSWRYERPDLISATSVVTVQAVGFYDVLRKASPAQRKDLEAALLHSDLGLEVVPFDRLINIPKSFLPKHTMLDGLEKARPHLSAVTSLVRLGPTTEAGTVADRVQIALALGDGSALIFDPDRNNNQVNLPRFFIPMTVTALFVPLAVLSLWGARMLTAPLRRLAEGADRFAIDLDATPLAQQGPAEIQKLAHAFNTMKSRIRQLVDSRSRMLAAVSHDLRTPLTRLRLRAETLPDGDDKERMLKDVVTMDAMIGQTLSYLRDQASPKSREPVDLATLVSSICDDFADTGHNATYEGPRNVVLECEPDLLTRAVSNLVDNALKFGDVALVRLETRSASEVVIHIEDEGPGIPDDQKFMAFEPFSRGDAARGAPETEGFGLGLAIARQIVERHGGHVTLHDRQPRGLRVQVVLPVVGANVGTSRIRRSDVGHQNAKPKERAT
jgi:signal transduction histidine kinase